MSPVVDRGQLSVELLRGHVDLEVTDRGLVPHRLPAWAVAQAADPQLTMAEAQPSGVRLVFRTAASHLELDVIPTKRVYAGAPPRPDGHYDLVVDGLVAGSASARAGDVTTIDMATGSVDQVMGEPETLLFTGLGATEKTVEIWLPHNEATTLVTLRADAPVLPLADDRPRWLHHGSSISHGSNADRPTGTWPAIAARRAGVDLTNLGFGGSALLDPFVARVIRDTPADLISVKLGINLVNNDVMRLRAFRAGVHGWLDTIRDGHPTTPVLLVGPILCPIHEDTPGPSAMDTSALAEGRLSFTAAGDPAEVAAGKLTLTVIRAELARIVAQRSPTDSHLHLVEGLDLYGPADHERLPLPDRLHPDAATHELIGERFTATVKRHLGPAGA